MEIEAIRRRMARHEGIVTDLHFGKFNFKVSVECSFGNTQPVGN